MKRTLILTALLAMVVTVAGPVVAFASTTENAPVETAAPTIQDTHEATNAAGRNAAVGYGLAALAAALAVGLAAIGTGYAQAKIGTAGGGALAEKPELAGVMIILVAIPETAVILGFVIAISLLGKL